MSSYIQQWNTMFQDQQSQQQNLSEIDLYYNLETQAYQQILADPEAKWSGEFSKIQEKLGFKHKPVIFAGFLEGINNSLHTPLNLDDIDDDSEINLDVDFSKLFIAMHEAKADWLYNLEDWDKIIPQEEQQQMVYDWRQSKIVRTEKVGRNDPCPCGSGKKHKKCCGK